MSSLALDLLTDEDLTVEIKRIENQVVADAAKKRTALALYKSDQLNVLKLELYRRELDRKRFMGGATV